MKALLLAAALAAPAAAGGPGTVILISVDTLRADHLGCYGGRKDATPAIDALAADAVLFENHIAAASWTTPSHMSIFTSLYPSEHRLTRVPKEFRLSATLGAFWRTLRSGGPAALYRRYVTDKRTYPLVVDRQLVTLPAAMKEAGYATAGFVSSRFLTHKLGFARGFDEYSWEHFKKGPDRIARSLDFLDRNRDGKAFLFLHLYDAHGDLGLVDLDFKCRFSGSVFSPPPPWAGRYSSKLERGEFDGTFDTLIPLLRSGRFTPRDAAYLSALYDEGVAYTDSLLGGFFGELRRRGLYDDALIVLLSDHGEALGENLEVGHNCTFSHGVVHVPLIVKLPGGEAAGRRVRSPVSGIDVFPTLLGAAGITPPPALKAQMRGADLRACLKPGGACSSPFVYSETNCAEYGRVLRGCVSADGWRLVHNLANGSSSLYNIRSAPEKDRSGDPALSGRAAELEEAIMLKFTPAE